MIDISKMTEQVWKAAIELGDGIKGTYRWFLKNGDELRKLRLCKSSTY